MGCDCSIGRQWWIVAHSTLPGNQHRCVKEYLPRESDFRKRSRQTSCLAIIWFSPFSRQWQYKIFVAPYSRPVPYSRHPPYSRHFFNDTHENDCVWALFPIAVSGDHFFTQVCKEILSILSIFFGEAFLVVSCKIVFAWRFVVPLNINIFKIPR